MNSMSEQKKGFRKEAFSKVPRKSDDVHGVG